MKMSEFKAAFLAEYQRADEKYAGLLLGKGDAPDQHIFLLPERKKEINWYDSNDYAAREGCILATRREQMLVVANLREELEPGIYWSSEESSADYAWAWHQGFEYGSQTSFRKGARARAFFVRRLVLE